MDELTEAEFGVLIAAQQRGEVIEEPPQRVESWREPWRLWQEPMRPVGDWRGGAGGGRSARV